MLWDKYGRMQRKDGDWIRSLPSSIRRRSWIITTYLPHDNLDVESFCFVLEYVYVLHFDLCYDLQKKCNEI